MHPHNSYNKASFIEVRPILTQVFSWYNGYVKDFLKVVGLLLVIGAAVAVIFWGKGSYGIQPTIKGKTCNGFVSTAFAAANNFPNGKVSFTLYNRTLIYYSDKSIPNSYCIGYIES